MYKALVEYTIKFIAYISNLYPNIVFENIKDYVKSFIINELSEPEIHAYMRMLEESYKKFRSNSSAKNVASLSNIESLIRETSRDVPMKQKMQLMIRILMFEKTLLQLSSGPIKSNVNYSEIMELMANSLNINNQEYKSCKYFISETLYKIENKENLLIMGNSKLFELNLRFIPYHNLKGHLFFLQILSIPDMFLFYFKGNDLITMNRKPLFPRQVYFFSKGYSLNVPGNNDITYRHIQMEFLETLKITENASF